MLLANAFSWVIAKRFTNGTVCQCTWYLTFLTTDAECTCYATFVTCLSVCAICFEDRVCTSKKCGIGGGGQTQSWHAVHVLAVMAGCRQALVSTGLAISLLFSTKWHRNRSSSLLGAPFWALWAVFSQEEQLLFSQEEHSLVGEPWPL